MIAHTVPQLTALVTTVLVPDQQSTMPPEGHAILAAIAALPEGQYVAFDPEQGTEGQWEPGYPPAAIKLVPHQRLTSWDGSAQDSWGYGWLEIAHTAAGPVLDITVGGSPLQSATGFVIVPAGVFGLIDEE